MRTLNGPQVLMRIFIGESAHLGGRPLYKQILRILRENGIAGATVLRGIAGFGGRSRLHSANLLGLSADLPIIIEVVDSQEHLDAVLPLLDQRIGEGMITMEKVQVIRYALTADEPQG